MTGEISEELYRACRTIAEEQARRAGAPGVSEADIEEVWIRSMMRDPEEVSPAMIAAGLACLKRAHLPHLGPGPGLIEAYRAMRAQFKKEKGIP